ncbi:hypothetical protein N7510_005143 [Penicillium lagena]|uniref:uncharacterized protein n=1 Tax=Penicillium lagena TaxID=94218 RepID=UPI0025424ADC|nr:uncharacterized protein N7510_005143 [Penicillium lagena]KAJ5621159.1 hypothetical protein N7510_005143 [Penicillium lagena]
MPQKNDERRVMLALQAMQNDPKLSARAAGRIYSVDHEKLSRRKRGIQSRRDILANSRILTDLEESVLIQHILDLAIKGFPPRVSIVGDMANRLLATRDAPRVGMQSHHSDEFEEYCKGNNIITLCMPPHSSHILQPLDIGCFSLLKKVYGRHIEDMMRAHITHITKDDFFPAFRSAFFATMTESNIQGGFRGAGLIPFDPESVISTLDLKLKTPTPTTSRPRTPEPWVSQTPNNPIEATSQTTFIKNRIAYHNNSSPTSIYEAVDQFAKGTSKIMHKLALLQSEVQILRQANEELSKRRRAKKTRLRQGRSLSQQEAQDLQDERDIMQQIKQETQARSGRKPRQETRARRCSNCGETGHNARTCQIVIETSEEEDY